MKKFYRLLVLAVLLFSPIAQAEIKTLDLSVKGLSCAICASKAESVLKKINGVTEVTVDHKAEKGTVKYDSTKTNPEEILKVCNEKSGFKCQ